MNFLQTRTESDILVVSLTQERLDAKIAVSFKEQMAQYINDGHLKIILDMSGVTFVDSSGLGAIVTCLKLLGRKGDMIVSGAKDDVMTMFILTRMDKVFRLASSVEEALSSLLE